MQGVVFTHSITLAGGRGGGGEAGESSRTASSRCFSFPVATSLTFFLLQAPLNSDLNHRCVPLALRCVMHCGGTGTATQKIITNTTVNNGYLGSCIDEERSELRYVM